MSVLSASLAVRSEVRMFGGQGLTAVTSHCSLRVAILKTFLQYPKMGDEAMVTSVKRQAAEIRAAGW